MAKFDHERAHMAANLVSDPPVHSNASRYNKVCKYMHLVFMLTGDLYIYIRTIKIVCGDLTGDTRKIFVSNIRPSTSLTQRTF